MHDAYILHVYIELLTDYFSSTELDAKLYCALSLTIFATATWQCWHVFDVIHTGNVKTELTW